MYMMVSLFVLSAADSQIDACASFTEDQWVDFSSHAMTSKGPARVLRIENGAALLRMGDSTLSKQCLALRPIRDTVEIERCKLYQHVEYWYQGAWTFGWVASYQDGLAWVKGAEERAVSCDDIRIPKPNPRQLQETFTATNDGIFIQVEIKKILVGMVFVTTLLLVLAFSMCCFFIGKRKGGLQSRSRHAPESKLPLGAKALTEVNAAVGGRVVRGAQWCETCHGGQDGSAVGTLIEQLQQDTWYVMWDKSATTHVYKNAQLAVAPTNATSDSAPTNATRDSAPTDATPNSEPSSPSLVDSPYFHKEMRPPKSSRSRQRPDPNKFVFE